MIREGGGEKIILDVIDGNLPAYNLYHKLGFEHYSSDIEFQATPKSAAQIPELHEGYIQLPLGRFEWQPRYALEKRTTPVKVGKYEPVEVDRFRQSGMERLLMSIVMYTQGVYEEHILVQTKTDGQIVAYGGYTVPKRGKSIIKLKAHLDPTHPELASFLLSYLTQNATARQPGLRIELSIPKWQKVLVSTAEDAGFEQRMEYCRMGLELS